MGAAPDSRKLCPAPSGNAPSSLSAVVGDFASELPCEWNWRSRSKKRVVICHFSAMTHHLSAASDTQTSSLSFRQKTHLFAKAG